MLERYFVRPATVDRIRASWIGVPIEQYVTWLADKGYAARNVFHRVPVLLRFGEFAHERGATRVEDLSSHIDTFVEQWTEKHGTKCTTTEARKKVASSARNPVEQMLRLAVPGFSGRRRARWARVPFEGRVGGFFDYLTKERGLRQASVHHYHHHLGPFEAYLERVGCRHLAALSPRFWVRSLRRAPATFARRACAIAAASSAYSCVTFTASA